MSFTTTERSSKLAAALARMRHRVNWSLSAARPGFNQADVAALQIVLNHYDEMRRREVENLEATDGRRLS
jgi:hypothetical protein